MLEKSEVESVLLFRYIPNEGDIYHNQVCLPDLMSRSSIQWRSFYRDRGCKGYKMILYKSFPKQQQH